MTFEMLDTDVLNDQLQQNATEFSAALVKLAVYLDANISSAFRKGILRVFREIHKRSPVDTGAYRASHGISNLEPSDTQGIVNGVKGEKIANNVSEKSKEWTWGIRDGEVWLYNNQPYAERIENGWSNLENKPRMRGGKDFQSVIKAPEGVYRVSLSALTQFMNQEFAKLGGLLEPDGSE